MTRWKLKTPPTESCPLFLMPRLLSPWGTAVCAGPRVLKLHHSHRPTFCLQDIFKTTRPCVSSGTLRTPQTPELSGREPPDHFSKHNHLLSQGVSWNGRRGHHPPFKFYCRAANMAFPYLSLH